MENKYERIADYIYDCYKNEAFDLSKFMFYKLRKEKGKYKVGIYKEEDNKYFFKIVSKEDYNDEIPIQQKIDGYFNIVDKYCSKQVDDDVINLYKYVDTTRIDAFNYLRNASISMDEKETKLNQFFDKYIAMQKKYLLKEKMDGKRFSDMWFHDRIKQTSRANTFYGNNFCDLLDEINITSPELLNDYKLFFDNIYNYLGEQRELLSSYMHGDFHDFNFSLNGIFWDTDTFGMNPLLNDFSVYYWHFYGREDGLIYKYSPWLVERMHNQLSNKELLQVRDMKEQVITKWYNFIKESYYDYNISDNLKPEFLFKLFCRMFLIDNIFNYDQIDREKVINFFGSHLTNKEVDDQKVLFKSNISFLNK